jgi:branched-chain amino acid transport system ATP-binding protein
VSRPILELRSVARSFGGLRAVDGVSLSVAAGEMLGIAGPNGSGKSTLFNLATGIPYGPSGGEVWLDGTRIDGWPAHRIARAGMARTFQKDAEFPDLNAVETVMLGAVYAAGLSPRDAPARAAEALDRVRFDPARRGMRTDALSVFEKKQLMIASALAARPRLLMLDEPASGLTRPEIEDLDALLVAINASGVTVVLIEHVLSLLLSISQRLVVLNQGRVLAEGEPRAVIRDPGVIEAYLGGRAA